MKIMVVEADPNIARGLRSSLELEGYQVALMTSLEAARAHRVQNPVDLILLGLELPDGSGLNLLKEIRLNNNQIGIVILTTETNEDFLVEALHLGANDYIKIPFSIRELLARLKSALREPAVRDSQMKFGELVIHVDQRKISAGEKNLELNRREYDILFHFVKNAEAIVTRESLLQNLDKEGEIFDRTIDSHISHLRAKLRKLDVESVKISSVYGVGYRLERV